MNTYEKDGSWWVAVRKGDTVIHREAGPDRETAEAVGQLIIEEAGKSRCRCTPSNASAATKKNT